MYLDQHGTSGPMSVDTSTQPIFPVWKQGWTELGYAYVDLNGPQRQGR